jgi:hypothetical protein
MEMYGSAVSSLAASRSGPQSVRRFLLVSLLVLSVCPGSAGAAELASLSSEELAEQYVNQYELMVRIEAELDLMKQFVPRMKPDALNWALLGKTPSQLDGVTRQELALVLTAHAESLADQVDQYEEELLASRVVQVRSDWLDVREERNRYDVIRARLVNRQPGSKWVSLIGKDNRWFWLASVFAVGCLVFVSWHDRRHEYRRALNGAKARTYNLTRLLKLTFYLMILFTLVAFFGSERLARYLAGEPEDVAIRSREDMQKEIEVIIGNRERLEKESKDFQPRFEQAQERWLAVESELKLRKPWKEIVERVLRARTHLVLQERLTAELQNDRDKLKELARVIEANHSAVAEVEQFKWMVSGGVGLGLTGLTLGMGAWLLASIQRRDHRNKHTCPMCLGYNTLELDDYDSTDGINSNLPMLRCGHTFPNGSVCGFTFPPFYQELNKVYFPTLGIPQAGKTHCVAMVYRELNAGRYSENVQFEKVDSQSSQDFDDIVRRIIDVRVNPQPTQQAEQPHPLIFNFCDNDPWGRSNLLVNVFDYSGEVAQGILASLSEAQRRRALKADGYLFFLDPTAGRDIQEEALNRFRRDLRVIERVKADRALRAPVALCISKIDLLAEHSPAPPAFVEHFHNKLREIDPGGQNISFATIAARSELARQLREVIWPGWNIERLIHDLFGGRYMYFPLTPVNLDTPPGVSPTDLANRTIDPFGIVEPLVWLLHMNGYRF